METSADSISLRMQRAVISSSINNWLCSANNDDMGPIRKTVSVLLFRTTQRNNAALRESFCLTVGQPVIRGVSQNSRDRLIVAVLRT